MVYCLCCVCFTFVSSIIIFFFNVMLVDQVVLQGFDARKQILNIQASVIKVC